jgi:hypothetical protein
MRAAVALFIFNRPDCTRRVLDVVRQARPHELFVIADGPRAMVMSDRAKCAEAREVIERGIDWPCDLKRAFANENLGCARRVASGLDWVFSQVDKVILLEDDCVPDPTFFRFCDELLERYRDEPRIAQIAGCSFQSARPPAGPSYYFSRYPHCWGWATWRRAWRHYDPTMQNWGTERGRDWLERQLEKPAERRLWAGAFDAVENGRADSWAYRWTMTVWKRDWLSILPYQNLVSNIGFGREATHTRRPNPAAARPLTAMPFPLVHPDTIARDALADDYTSELLFTPPTWRGRLRRGLQRIFSR